MHSYDRYFWKPSLPAQCLLSETQCLLSVSRQPRGDEHLWGEFSDHVKRGTPFGREMGTIFLNRRTNPTQQPLSPSRWAKSQHETHPACAGLCHREDVFFLRLNAPLGVARHFLGAQTQPFQPHGHLHPTLAPLKGIWLRCWHFPPREICLFAKLLVLIQSMQTW